MSCAAMSCGVQCRVVVAACACSVVARLFEYGCRGSAGDVRPCSVLRPRAHARAAWPAGGDGRVRRPGHQGATSRGTGPVAVRLRGF